MKIKSLLLSAILWVAFAAPVFAQNAGTEYQLNAILGRHPELAANPALVNSPNWQHSHPDAYAWFRHHPKAMRQTSRMGAWETNGTWHNPNWWFQNNPNWVYQNRPDWIQRYPAWRQRGDWDDDDHAWHDRDWYWQNRREWAEHHHPEWREEEGEEAREHQGPPYGHAWGHYKHKHHHDDD